MASIKHLTEVEKIERKKKQKREAQKRYYQKNKDYYINYNKNNSYTKKLQQENKKLHNKIDKAIEYIHQHGNSECEYLDVWETKELLEILKDSDVDE